MKETKPTDPVLTISNLSIEFHLRNRVIPAVSDLSFVIERGQIVCLVGESGCGKSVTALSITGLVPKPPAIVQGSIEFKGQDLIALSEREMRKIRGSRISTIFQEPMTSLNPLFPVGKQIADIQKEHRETGTKHTKESVLDLLKLVHIPDPEQRYYAYPHQLSGGMRQRIMIAMALASGNPDLLIADEPTTALDVTIQAQILSIAKDIQKQTGLSILFITHDMTVVSQIADRIIVIYAGKKMEEGDVDSILNTPRHPYTRGLLASMPSHSMHKKRLETIPGSVDVFSGKGCPFAGRCPHVLKECHEIFPEASEFENGQKSWCHVAKELS